MNEALRELLRLPEQASTIAAEVDRFHYFVIGVTMLGAFAVAAVAAFLLVRYRQRSGEPARQVGRYEMGIKLEVGLVGTLVVLFFWWWWIGIRQYMRIEVTPPNTAEVYVVAKQWMFKFSYPEGNSSVHTLYVPAGRPIKLVLTSRDVIHDFYVPAFRIKQDMVPGRYTTIWFEAKVPGAYQILCAEFCGTGHSQMRGTVVALPPAQYAAWLEGTSERDSSMIAQVARAEQPGEGLELVDVGAAVAAEHGCLRCHTTDGTPHIGPSFAQLYGATVPLADGDVIIADEAYLTESMMDPLAHIHRGYQAVMPSYKGRLRAADTAALLELIKALREGDQPQYPPAKAAGLPLYPEPEPRAGEENAR